MKKQALTEKDQLTQLDNFENEYKAYRIVRNVVAWLVIVGVLGLFAGIACIIIPGISGFWVLIASGLWLLLSNAFNWGLSKTFAKKIVTEIPNILDYDVSDSGEPDKIKMLNEMQRMVQEMKKELREEGLL